MDLIMFGVLVLGILLIIVGVILFVVQLWKDHQLQKRIIWCKKILEKK